MSVLMSMLATQHILRVSMRCGTTRIVDFTYDTFDTYDKQHLHVLDDHLDDHPSSL